MSDITEPDNAVSHNAVSVSTEPVNADSVNADLAAFAAKRSGRRRAEPAPKPRTGKRLLVSGAVAAGVALLGGGLAVPTAFADSTERVSATRALSASTALPDQQLNLYGGADAAHATYDARRTIDDANATIASAKGKTDASHLTEVTATLAKYSLLPSDRVYELVDETSAESTKVKAAVKEADRIAAEKAAAAKRAAAKKAAEEKAAAEKAAAEKAAAEKAAAEQAAQAESSDGGGGGGGGGSAAASRPSAPSNPSGAQAIARDMMSQYGWGDGQFGCLVSLWDRESGWNVNAYNASSGATGIPQALPGSKMASAGSDWQTNPATQIAWGLGYISGSYGSPCAAWDHSESVGWY